MIGIFQVEKIELGVVNLILTNPIFEFHSVSGHKTGGFVNDVVKSLRKVLTILI